jgi:acyl transferase domain-containing protein
MVAVGAGEEEIAPLLAGHEHEVSIAAVNGPTSVVISGAEQAVLAIAGRIRANGRRTKRLRISHASHSPLVAPMLAEFGQIAGQMSYSAPRIPVVSTLSGRPADAGDLMTPGYWVRQLRETVRFHDAVRALQSAGVRTFLEVGSADTLTGMIQENLTTSAEAVPIMRPGYGESSSLLTALAQLHVRGRTLVVAPPAGHVPLPTYPFERKRYWLERITMPHDDNPPVLEKQAPEQAEEPAQTLAGRLAGRPAAERRKELMAFVIELAAAALGHENAEEFDEETGFFDVGFSSLTAVQMRNKINQACGLDTSPMLLFDYPTPAMLTQRLEELLFTDQAN